MGVDPTPTTSVGAESVVVHGATATDPVANASNCCFGCDVHECMVASCGACDELMVWTWREFDPPKWVHIHPSADRCDFQWEPPEHWEWILQERQALVIDGHE